MGFVLSMSHGATTTHGHQGPPPATAQTAAPQRQAGGLCAARLQHAAGARSAAKQVRDPENDQSATKKVKREIKQEITTTTTIKQEPLSSQISKLFDAGGSFKQEKDEDEDDDWETTQVGPEIKEEDEEFDWLGPAANATEEAVETEKIIMRIGRFSGY